MKNFIHFYHTIQNIIQVNKWLSAMTASVGIGTGLVHLILQCGKSVIFFEYTLSSNK